MRMRSMLEPLLSVPIHIWYDYALCYEPLREKMQGQEGTRLTEEAHRTGFELAEQVAGRLGRDPETIADHLGISVERLSRQDEGNYQVFALFTEPDRISLYQNVLDAAEEMLCEEGGCQLFSSCSLSDILIAHELYHWYEYKNNLPTSKKVLTLWSIAGYAYKSKVLALGEIAAMAFAQSLLQLPWSPFCLDFILLYPTNKSLALEKYEYIIRQASLKGEN